MRRECRDGFPRHWLQRKPLVTDPGVHQGMCVMHVPWRMSGSLTCGSGIANPRFRHYRRVRNQRTMHSLPYLHCLHPRNDHPIKKHEVLLELPEDKWPGGFIIQVRCFCQACICSVWASDMECLINCQRKKSYATNSTAFRRSWKTDLLVKFVNESKFVIWILISIATHPRI